MYYITVLRTTRNIGTHETSALTEVLETLISFCSDNYSTIIDGKSCPSFLQKPFLYEVHFIPYNIVSLDSVFRGSFHFAKQLAATTPSELSSSSVCYCICWLEKSSSSVVVDKIKLYAFKVFVVVRVAKFMVTEIEYIKLNNRAHTVHICIW